jgi:acylphosphatase
MLPSDLANFSASSVRVIYHGRVQGVGFRWTTARIARHHPVRGTVRNRSDGSVELLAGGEPADLRAFLAEIHQAMGSGIERYEIAELSDPIDREDFAIIR